MFEKILIPLDGSKISESALPYAEDLVSKLSPKAKIDVILVHILPKAHPVYTAGEIVPRVVYDEEHYEMAKKRAMEYLDNAGEGLRSRGATVIPRVQIGDASEGIIKIAEETNADLIIMSTHGRSGISRWAFGSVAEKVLHRKTKVPILIVKASSSPDVSGKSS